jgi:hypothetical protein
MFSVANDRETKIQIGLDNAGNLLAIWGLALHSFPQWLSSAVLSKSAKSKLLVFQLKTGIPIFTVGYLQMNQC